MSSKRKKLRVFIPDTYCSNVPSLRERTVYVSMLARAFTIFRVNEVVIYRESPSSPPPPTADEVVKILRYLETPQYLRKHLFKLNEDLKYVGAAPPLRAPHHKPYEPLNKIAGTYREGVVVARSGEGSVVDIGLGVPAYVAGRYKVGTRLTLRIDSLKPKVRATVVSKDAVPTYWGFEVKRVSDTITTALEKLRAGLTIITSRKGAPLADVWWELSGAYSASRTVNIVFGGPSRGLFEIMGEEGTDPYSVTKFVVNFIPDQGAETVRTEEAVFAVLSILNIMSRL